MGQTYAQPLSVSAVALTICLIGVSFGAAAAVETTPRCHVQEDQTVCCAQAPADAGERIVDPLPGSPGLPSCAGVSPGEPSGAHTTDGPSHCEFAVDPDDGSGWISCCGGGPAIWWGGEEPKRPLGPC